MTPDQGDDKPSLLKRLAWMAAIWAASVAVLGVVAWIIRLVLGA